MAPGSYQLKWVRFLIRTGESADTIVRYVLENQEAFEKHLATVLLCDRDGRPIAVEVFKGNTIDHQTVRSQVAKLKERFGLRRVVFVSDHANAQHHEYCRFGALPQGHRTNTT